MKSGIHPDVWTASPVNGTAQTVVSQGGCRAGYEELDLEELAEIWRTLDERRKALKEFLGITNKTQHTNFMNRFKKKGRNTRTMKGGNEKRDAALEYVKLGQNMIAVQQAITDKRRVA